MRRGEIRIVDLDPLKGSEANKRRPAVIVSNDGANTTAERLGRGVVTIVPVTSNTETVHPFQVLLPAAETGVFAFGIRRTDISRFGNAKSIRKQHGREV